MMFYPYLCCQLSNICAMKAHARQERLNIFTPNCRTGEAFHSATSEGRIGSGFRVVTNNLAKENSVPRAWLGQNQTFWTMPSSRRGHGVASCCKPHDHEYLRKMLRTHLGSCFP